MNAQIMRMFVEVANRVGQARLEFLERVLLKIHTGHMDMLRSGQECLVKCAIHGAKWDDVQDIVDGMAEKARIAYYTGWLVYVMRHSAVPPCTPGYGQHIFYLGPVAGERP